MRTPYPTADAQKFLTDYFGLPTYYADMQDWPLEVADGSRLAEFCDAYEAGIMPTENAQSALMHLLLVSLDEVLPRGLAAESTPEAERIAGFLRRDFARYIKIIDYWRATNDSDDDPDAEYGFAISRMMRDVWNEE